MKISCSISIVFLHLYMNPFGSVTYQRKQSEICMDCIFHTDDLYKFLGSYHSPYIFVLYSTVYFDGGNIWVVEIEYSIFTIWSLNNTYVFVLYSDLWNTDLIPHTRAARWRYPYRHRGEAWRCRLHMGDFRELTSNVETQKTKSKHNIRWIDITIGQCDNVSLCRWFLRENCFRNFIVHWLWPIFIYMPCYSISHRIARIKKWGCVAIVCN